MGSDCYFDLALEALHAGPCLPRRIARRDRPFVRRKTHELFGEMAAHGFTFLERSLQHYNNYPKYDDIRHAVYETVYRSGDVGRYVAALCRDLFAPKGQLA